MTFTCWHCNSVVLGKGPKNKPDFNGLTTCASCGAAYRYEFVLMAEPTLDKDKLKSLKDFMTPEK